MAYRETKHVFVYRFGGQSYRKMLLIIAFLVHHASRADVSSYRPRAHIPIPRAELAFQHITMDCIGLIDPPSSKGHKYCLCIVVSCTRWPAVYPLKSLNARKVCDVIIDLFMQTAIATVVPSDIASNFVNKLTQVFEARLGCSQGLISHVTQRLLESVRDGTRLRKTRYITRFVNH